jgi:hypothetical protein
MRRLDTPGPDGSLRVGALEIDPRARRALIDGREVGLTQREFDLLRLLASEPGTAFDRERIFRSVWGTRWFGSPKTIDVHVAAAAQEARRPGLDRDRARHRVPAPRGMSRRLLLSYLSLTLLVLAVLEVPLGITYSRNERRDLEVKVERDAVTVASLSEGVLERTGEISAPALRGVAKRYRADTGGRVVVVDRLGRRVVDSNPIAGDTRFGTRPEIKVALAGRVASGVRHSNTLGADLLYVAVPIASGGTVLGAAAEVGAGRLDVRAPEEGPMSCVRR